SDPTPASPECSSSSKDHDEVSRSAPSVSTRSWTEPRTALASLISPVISYVIPARLGCVKRVWPSRLCRLRPAISPTRRPASTSTWPRPGWRRSTRARLPPSRLTSAWPPMTSREGAELPRALVLTPSQLQRVDDYVESLRAVGVHTDPKALCPARASAPGSA